MPNDKHLWARETFVDRTKNAMFGESDAYETFATSPGDLYRAMRKEYGRCISKQYTDLNDGQTRVSGWVFLSRQKYEDARDNRPSSYYLREVWVTVLDGPDTVTRTQHPHYLD